VHGGAQNLKIVMASSGSQPSSPAAGATYADGSPNETTALQQRLNAKRQECASLQAMLTEATADKAAAHEGGLAGIRAAKAHMTRLRSELVTVRRWRDEHVGETKPTGQQATEEDEQTKSYRNDLQLSVRALRHELARWKHQVQITEAKGPRQEEEIARLKAELTHTLDVLSSTQHAVKHHEIEREYRDREASTVKPSLDDTSPEKVSLHGGGHGCVEATAERHVRQKIEDKNLRLSGKAKRLSGVVAAQQLLIQRLEKKVLLEEKNIGQKDDHLQQQSASISQLTKMVRKQSDVHVRKMLGVATQQPNGQKMPSANSSISDTRGSASMPRLPPI